MRVFPRSFPAVIVALLGALPLVATAFSLSGTISNSGGRFPVVLASVDPVAKTTAQALATMTDGEGRFTLEGDLAAGLYELQFASRKITLALAGDESVRLQTAAESEAATRIEGAPFQDALEAYEAFRRASLARRVYPVRGALRDARAANDTAAVERLTEAEVSEYAAHRRELNDFSLAAVGPTPVLFATALRWDGDYRREDLAATVQAFRERYPESPAGDTMAAQISRFEALAIGAVAPELEAPDPAGVDRALADLRGDWVLVDFWASWCPPCRIENRHYAQLYARYEDAGFEIYAVSVDHQRSGWERAIRQDAADWIQVSDLSGWKSPLAAAYNVSALPANLLLDPAGRIVAKDLRGEALAAKLAEVLGEP